jgi:hypothetical protein
MGRSSVMQTLLDGSQESKSGRGAWSRSRVRDNRLIAVNEWEAPRPRHATYSLASRTVYLTRRACMQVVHSVRAA